MTRSYEFAFNAIHRSVFVLTYIYTCITDIHVYNVFGEFNWFKVIVTLLRNVATSVSVCLSVRPHISRTTPANFTKLSLYVICVRGSILLRRRCDMLRTSGISRPDCVKTIRNPCLNLLVLKTTCVLNQLAPIAILTENC